MSRLKYVGSKNGYDIFTNEEKMIFQRWFFKIPIIHNGKIYSFRVNKLNKKMQKYAFEKFKNLKI